MTDPVLIADRTALETTCESCGGIGSDANANFVCHACRAPEFPHAPRGWVLREFVVLGDAQLMVPNVQPLCGADSRSTCDWPMCKCIVPTELVPAPVGSTYHDVEIAEIAGGVPDPGPHEDDSLGSSRGRRRSTTPVPFARVRSVRVVERDKLILACDNHNVRWDGELLKAPMFDALPDGDPLFVLDHVEAL